MTNAGKHLKGVGLEVRTCPYMYTRTHPSSNWTLSSPTFRLHDSGWVWHCHWSLIVHFKNDCYNVVCEYPPTPTPTHRHAYSECQYSPGWSTLCYSLSLLLFLYYFKLEHLTMSVFIFRVFIAFRVLVYVYVLCDISISILTLFLSWHCVEFWL